VDKSDPLYLYSLTRTFSSYHNYSDSPDYPFSSFDDLSKDFESFETNVPTSVHSLDAKRSADFEESVTETGNSEKSFDVIELPEENVLDLNSYNLEEEKCETVVKDSENVVVGKDIDQEFPGESQNAGLNSLTEYTSVVSINQNEGDVKATECSDLDAFHESVVDILTSNSSADNCCHKAVSNSAENKNLIEKRTTENENGVEKKMTEDENVVEERTAENQNVVKGPEENQNAVD
jgi:hypothetical protein